MKKLLTIITCALLCAVSFASCSNNGDASGDKTITVAASTSPHAEILEQCVQPLADKGYTLEIKRMDDYITPNTATEGGDVDANYFQHQPYLDHFNAENGTHLVSVAKVHYEPLGIYAGTSATLADLPEGAKIAVPNDATNEARALMLLETNGLITLKEGAGLTATKNDIVEMEAALVPRVLSEVGIGVINGNYAIPNGLKTSDALAKEDPDSEAAQTYANVLVVKEGNENLEKITALKEALLSQTVKDYIAETYEGAVIAIF